MRWLDNELACGSRPGRGRASQIRVGATIPDASEMAWYYGHALRAGVQFNDRWAVYGVGRLGVHPSYDSLGLIGVVGLGGDVTMLDRFFVGAMAGLYAGRGVDLGLRVGGYPILGRSGEGLRRWGLLISGEVHMLAVFDFVAVNSALYLGYEAF